MRNHFPTLRTRVSAKKLRWFFEIEPTKPHFVKKRQKKTNSFSYKKYTFSTQKKKDNLITWWTYYEISRSWRHIPIKMKQIEVLCHCRHDRTNLLLIKLMDWSWQRRFTLRITLKSQRNRVLSDRVVLHSIGSFLYSPIRVKSAWFILTCGG